MYSVKMIWFHTVLIWFTLYHVSAKSKYVSVGLSAKWKSTPLMLEASEFLAQESNNHFWQLVESMAELPYSSYQGHDEKEMYELTIKKAEEILLPLQIKLLKFALAMRAMSPAVSMNQQIAHDKNPPTECSLFVDINNMITCEEGALAAFLSAANKQDKPVILKNDHHYPGSEGRDTVAILYADFTSQEFKSFHKILKKKADEGKIDYILRHYVKEPRGKKVMLSGYGVELAIKSTEYKAKDDTKVEGEKDKVGKEGEDEEEVEGFLFGKLRKLHPDLTDKLDEFQKHMKESTREMAPLKVWQLQDLSFQAAQRVLSARKEEALALLRDISQNFPMQTRQLVRTTVKDEVRKEILKNQRALENQFGLGPGESAMFINGYQADLDIYDVFTLLETLRSEAKLLEGISSLGIEGEQATKLTRLNMKQADTAYALDVRNEAIKWVNDLEKDRRYQSWPQSVQELLRPTFPGMLRHIAKNFFTVVFIMNPANMEFKDVLKMAEAFYVHNAPVRMGLLVVSDKEASCEKDAGAAMACAFQYLCLNKKPAKGLSFITEVYDRLDDDELSAKFVKAEFASDFQDVDEDEVFKDGSIYDQARKEAVEYFEQTGLAGAPQVLINGMPMARDELNMDSFEEAVVTKILKQTNELQRAVYNGHLKDSMDVMDYVNTQDHVMPRLNSRILSAESSFLDFTQNADVVNTVDEFTALSPPQMTSTLASSMKYLTKTDETEVRAVTMWLVGDFDSPSGRELLASGIKQLKHSNTVRLGIIHNPTSGHGGSADDISWYIQAALDSLSPTSIARMFITKLVKEDNVEALKDKSKTLKDLEVYNMDYDTYEKALKKFDGNIMKMHSAFCKNVLSFKPGQRGIITNGKILGPLEDNENFLLEDFNLLEKLTSKGAASKIAEVVKDMDEEGTAGSDLIMQVSSLLMSVPNKESRKEVQWAAEDHSILKIPPREDGPAYEVVAILDPASRAAQKYTPLIMVLQEVVNVNIKIFMNCREKLSEMPLKSFYRYVLEPEVKFAVDSSLSSGPRAYFSDLPSQPILTLGMDPPESWLVESVKAVYDLDNIVMEEVQSGVNAEFELEYLLLEGHCFDATTSQPPRGLQFVLGTGTKPDVVDTIVMANLGYFQLKATPGAWNLNLRHGRSSEIYEIHSHEYTDSPSDSPEVIIVMDSFKSKIIKVKVNKKKGKEKEDLLGGGQDSGGLWDSISSSFGGTATEPEEKEETLNIFSLASGHLYERFTRIMILSVLKHTKAKTKFWFLKNYLSPAFKDFIPHMAKEYGFEYELVQYKWPRWLHQQTEKQRIMWGYKILFLDVLFPLSVQKIIFVDADQIVRTDLVELRDFDLQGAPYGYTPFCDSRREMDGFRFWKSGYWASHLAGRRYHISALYVVDLKKFRRIAAGDRLRGQYQGLSQDPNSLANLDQDLPNNMIHQVSIKSLPQEWLWCETWCSDEEKANAKTIDLCNNPQTKEPKLQAAMRIVPEWKDYDAEVKSLWDKIYKKNNNTQKSGIPDTKEKKQNDVHSEL